MTTIQDTISLRIKCLCCEEHLFITISEEEAKSLWATLGHQLHEEKKEEN